ncbi:50S ribosomal protein L22 [Patescibacteria group bacterium]|uniref:Large ribosomal subunit protein uL22 n=1 Tax=candidate division WWE3 bacterium TaxID=2053526 RepID=A0A928TVA5_UNCKA|nr:50S ribosomal protein L22 [candidate division WWE3 bacterium]MCL4732758.1 50S ribosomal protein L22 [Patescibacteria group bacterium]MDL1952924.1 50S ribosomal protein L22 [Candidatus Uhrbacteria bacterium UHB]RIL00644.1 MAG: 50S ribosomal protein L22 [Candidatus Uhrbacteria bacterium]
MEVRARLRYLRMSPRKVRLVIDMVRGMKVSAAAHQLEFLQKEAAKPVLKLLKSAVANAEHNHKLDASSLIIKAITADGGPTLYRWMPRAHGRATPLRKRTTHITLVLTDGKADVKGAHSAASKKRNEHKSAADTSSAETKKTSAKAAASQRKVPIKSK